MYSDYYQVEGSKGRYTVTVQRSYGGYFYVNANGDNSNDYDDVATFKTIRLANDFISRIKQKDSL